MRLLDLEIHNLVAEIIRASKRNEDDEDFDREHLLDSRLREFYFSAMRMFSASVDFLKLRGNEPQIEGKYAPIPPIAQELQLEKITAGHAIQRLTFFAVLLGIKSESKPSSN